MEDLILAFVTLALSACVLSHIAQAGMDALVVIVSLASMPIVGLLAHERGRSRRRWVYVAAIIGPLAIPVLYFTVAISGLRRADSNSRPRA